MTCPSPRSAATALIIAAMVTALGCGTASYTGDESARTTVVFRPEDMVVRDVPATVDSNVMIGSDTMDRYYTEEGAQIHTPWRGLVSLPVMTRTVDRDGRVIYPGDGIRVKGAMSIEDFRAVVQAINTYEPPPPPKPQVQASGAPGEFTVTIGPRLPALRSRRIDVIWVRGPGHVQVNTMIPDKRRYYAHGDVVELRKEHGKWEVKSISLWVS